MIWLLSQMLLLSLGSCRRTSDNFWCFILPSTGSVRFLHLSPSLSLGFQIYSALSSGQFPLWNTLYWWSGKHWVIINYSCQAQDKSVTIIAGTIVAFSAEIGTHLDLFKSPQVNVLWILEKSLILPKTILSYLMRGKCGCRLHNFRGLKHIPRNFPGLWDFW